jgi:hypothetical protein
VLKYELRREQFSALVFGFFSERSPVVEGKKMEYVPAGGASEVLGHLAAGVASGVAGNTDFLKMAQSGKQAIRCQCYKTFFLRC